MQKPKLKVAKELIDAINTVSKWGVLIVGMFCLLFYSNSIGQLPEGISLGEGFAFYLISIGFLIVYAFYVAVSTCIGCVAVSFIVDIYKKFRKDKTEKRGQTSVRVNTKSMRPAPIIGIALTGVAGTSIAFFQDPAPASFFMMLSVIQGMFVYFLLEIRMTLNALSSEFVLSDERCQSTTLRKSQELDQKKLGQKIFLMALVICPLVLAPNKEFIIDAVFRVAQLRKDSATIQIKTTWATRLQESGLKSGASFLGSDYLEFRNVKVLLRSMGTKVVLELPPAKAGGKKVDLPVPADAIFVE